MLMLFYKHLNELYRSYSKSLRYFGSSPVYSLLLYLYVLFGQFVSSKCGFGGVITKTCPCKIKRFLKLSKMKIFSRKILIFFLFLLKT